MGGMSPKKQFIIDGSKFNSLNSLYDELERVLCSNFHMGRNLNAVNDVLRGGFGKFEYEEPIDLIWKSSEKSKTDLGHKKAGEEKTLFDELIEMIEGKSHINFVLE